MKNRLSYSIAFWDSTSESRGAWIYWIKTMRRARAIVLNAIKKGEVPIEGITVFRESTRGRLRKNPQIVLCVERQHFRDPQRSNADRLAEKLIETAWKVIGGRTCLFADDPLAWMVECDREHLRIMVRSLIGTTDPYAISAIVHRCRNTIAEKKATNTIPLNAPKH